MTCFSIKSNIDFLKLSNSSQLHLHQHFEKKIQKWKLSTNRKLKTSALQSKVVIQVPDNFMVHNHFSSSKLPSSISTESTLKALVNFRRFLHSKHLHWSSSKCANSPQNFLIAQFSLYFCSFSPLLLYRKHLVLSIDSRTNPPKLQSSQLFHHGSRSEMWFSEVAKLFSGKVDEWSKCLIIFFLTILVLRKFKYIIL